MRVETTEQAEGRQRHYREALVRAVGMEVFAALGNPDVTEIYVNADGVVWVDTRSAGRVVLGRLEPEAVQRFLNLVASDMPTVVNAGRPVLQAELPREVFLGSRLQGFVPPVAAAPCFNLRKPPAVVYGLDEYVAAGSLTAGWRGVLGEAVGRRRNVLVAGGTGSGKTTLVNSLLREIAEQGPQERVVILEDTVELQCAARDHLALRTTEGLRLKDLVKAALRTSPDRIVVGEVRDEAALDLCDAWETGHPGGCATVHAETALGALQRVERLARRGNLGRQEELVGSAIDLVVMIAGGARGRRVTEMVEVEGWDGREYRMRAVAS
jgi:P-type conjugative transfer ATPase TrbB